MRERDADRLKLADGRAAFEGERRQVRTAHRAAHVVGRQIRAFGRHALHGVHAVAQNADGLVRLPELVGVGIRHHEAVGCFRLVGASPFMVQIACGTLDVTPAFAKQPLDARPKVCHALCSFESWS